MGQVICRGAHDCNHGDCEHDQPHDHEGKACSYDCCDEEGIHCISCVPEAGEWRVYKETSASVAVWRIANGPFPNRTKWLRFDGIADDGKSQGPHYNFKTQAAAQAALDKYLGKEKPMNCEYCGEKLEPKCKGCSDWNKQNGCISTTLAPCPAYIDCDCQNKEVPYSELKVGQKYRIEQGQQKSSNFLTDGVYEITKISYQHKWFWTGGKAWTLRLYKFYNVGSTEPQTKETDMAGQELFTTAIAEIIEDKDGNKSIKVVMDEETKDAVRLSQAMIARYTDELIANTTKPLVVLDVVGKDSDGKWIRMDQI